MNTTPTSNRIAARGLFSRLVCLGFAALSFDAAIARAADAAPSQKPRIDQVQYGDLNLADLQGTEVLYRRIVLAAEKVCDSGDHRSVQALLRDRRCKELSVSRAVGSVNRPELTALYAAKTGRLNPEFAQTAKR